MPWAWLPDQRVTTGLVCPVANRLATALYAPRNLNDPVRWKFSHFRKTVVPAASSNCGRAGTGVAYAIALQASGGALNVGQDNAAHWYWALNASRAFGAGLQMPRAPREIARGNLTGTRMPIGSARSIVVGFGNCNKDFVVNHSQAGIPGGDESCNLCNLLVIGWAIHTGRGCRLSGCPASGMTL